MGIRQKLKALKIRFTYYRRRHDAIQDRLRRIRNLANTAREKTYGHSELPADKTRDIIGIIYAIHRECSTPWEGDQKQ